MKKWMFCVGLIAVVACDNEPNSPQVTEVPALPSATTEGFRAAVVLERSDRNSVVLAVRFDEGSERLGAYQGSITFGTDAFQFVDASVPDDGYRIFNAENAGRGVIKFAGFSVEGFTGAEALRINLKPDTNFDPSTIGLVIDVVGTIEGARVPRANLAVLDGVYLEPEHGRR